MVLCSLRTLRNQKTNADSLSLMRACCSCNYQQLLQKDPSLRLSSVDSLKTHRYFEDLSFEVMLLKKVSKARQKLQSSSIYALHAGNEVKTEISGATHSVLLETPLCGKTFQYGVIPRVRGAHSPHFLAPRCCSCAASCGIKFVLGRKGNQRLVKAFLVMFMLLKVMCIRVEGSIQSKSQVQTREFCCVAVCR